MKHPIDNLFREKFEQHSLPAPEVAWSRIEKEIPAARTTFFIWKVAAAIVLLIVSIALLIPTDKPGDHLAVITDKPQQKIPAKSSASDSMASKTPEKTKQEPTKKKNETKSVQKKSSPVILNFSKQQDEIAQAISPTQKEEVLQTNSETVASNDLTTITSVEGVLHEEVTSTTIVIAASEVNQKYLLPVSTSNATSSEKSASSFRKLLEKAEDLKTNATGFGELRQKKNDLLALSSDRTRDRNKKNERNN